jgi:hypothetical protein
MAAAVMRKGDQWEDAGPDCGIADGQLLLLRAVRPWYETILCFWIKVLACVLRRCRIPDFTRKIAVSCRIRRTNRTHTNRKSAADERIVIVHRNYALFLNWLSASSSAA